MWKLAILLLVANFDYATADCQCYENQDYTGPSAPISNAYETSDFSACYKNCSFVAYTGQDTYGWTGLTFQWGTTTNSGGVIKIYDGIGTSGTPLIQIAEGENVLSGSSKSQIKSTTPRITIYYEQSSTTAANVYYGTIKADPGLQAKTTTTTTVAPTTRTYSNPLYTHDPYLITHDLLVLINQKTSGGSVALNNLNAIAINFVTQLWTTTDVNSASSTRLSLATLTPYDPYYSIKGTIWGLSPNDIVSNVPRSGVTIEGDIDAALTSLAKLAYTVNTNTTTDSRTNVQRSILLLTAEWPSNAKLADAVKTQFDTYGVNLLVVGYQLTSDEQTSLLRPDRWYNAVNLDSSKTDTVANSFINPFYFNNQNATNFWCPQFPVFNVTSSNYVFFQEPYNYAGPYGTQDWSTFQSYDGQSNRYCNFANNYYTYNLPADKTSMKVQVFFELEAGKDFLNFYDASNNLIASFTGYDISASTFYTKTPTLTAQFTSDNKSVFRGFYVSITPQ